MCWWTATIAVALAASGPADPIKLDACMVPGWGPPPGREVLDPSLTFGSGKVWAVTLRATQRDFETLFISCLDAPGRDSANIKGRPRMFGRFTLPYWTLCSGITHRADEAEFAQVIRVVVGGKSRILSLSPKFARAPMGRRLTCLRITCSDLAYRKRARPSGPETLVAAYDYVFAPDVPVVHVSGKLTNVGDSLLGDVRLEHEFGAVWNWDCFAAARQPSTSFGECGSVGYDTLQRGSAFAAYSSGMKAGTLIGGGDDSKLSFRCEPGRWTAIIAVTAGDLHPGASRTFTFTLEAIKELPSKLWASQRPPRTAADAALKPIDTPIRWTPPPDDPIDLRRLAATLDRPRLRGVNVGLTPPTGPRWREDPNAVAISGDERGWVSCPDVVELDRQIQSWAKLGMNWLILGNAPKRDRAMVIAKARDAGYRQVYVSMPPDDYSDVPPAGRPDAFGLDEDKVYWCGDVSLEPDKFRSQLGKDITGASVWELHRRASRVFAEKWARHAADCRRVIPDSRCFFYHQLSWQGERYGLRAYVERLDRIFAEEFARQASDVHFVYFHYGFDNGLIERKCRTLQEAGIERVAFLAMPPYYGHPLQIIENYEAARRGGADSVVLFVAQMVRADGRDGKALAHAVGALANFPSPDQKVYILCERLRSVLQAIRYRKIVIRVPVGYRRDTLEAAVRRLGRAIPIVSHSEAIDTSGKLYTVWIGTPASSDQIDKELRAPELLMHPSPSVPGPGKGLIEEGRQGLVVTGSDSAGLAGAVEVFSHLCQLAAFPKEPWP